jgi:hypothetical protein
MSQKQMRIGMSLRSVRFLETVSKCLLIKEIELGI